MTTFLIALALYWLASVAILTYREARREGEMALWYFEMIMLCAPFFLPCLVVYRLATKIETHLPRNARNEIVIWKRRSTQ